MRCSLSLSCISATIGCFTALLAVHPLPGGTSLQLEKGGRGFVRSSPWYRPHVFRWTSDIVPIPVKGCQYPLDSSDQLRFVVRGSVRLSPRGPTRPVLARFSRRRRPRVLDILIWMDSKVLIASPLQRRHVLSVLRVSRLLQGGRLEPFW